jgi:hypothetical protein
MPDGNPNSLKIIDKMNWTGIGLEVYRDSWSKHKDRKEFDQAGIYILFGYAEDSNLPVVYIGQGDGIRTRIDLHNKNKDFWDKVLIFVSSNNSLNRAHITWLEWSLIKRAQEINRCKLDNNTTPNEPILTESEKADTEEFLNEILTILPLVEIRVFEKARKMLVHSNEQSKNENIKDTIIVPAREDGFKEVFLKQNSWYAIRLSAGKLKDIKYITAYQTAPVSAITHYAEVESIEPYGGGGKYKINFKGSAKKIGPIVFGNAKKGTLQGPRYTTFKKLQKAKKLNDL